LGTDLEGADLENVKFGGADLYEADFQGAFLHGAELLGARLLFAQLQGASLDFAQLQGASLGHAKMHFTVVASAWIWLASDASCATARVTDSFFDATLRSTSPMLRAPPMGITEFIRDYLADVPDAKSREASAKQMRDALIVDPARDPNLRVFEEWKKCENTSKNMPKELFETERAKLLRNLVCNAKDDYRADIARGVIRNWISKPDPDGVLTRELARGLLGQDGKTCAATADFDEGMRKALLSAISDSTKSSK
jgi:hypothetical protein